jgi:predicted RNase H-like HicB family nuclease
MQVYEFKVLLEPDEEAGGYVVTCPSLPGCYSQGETVEEAMSNIREAIELCLEDSEGALPTWMGNQPRRRQPSALRPRAWGERKDSLRFSSRTPAPQVLAGLRLRGEISSAQPGRALEG